MNLWVQENYTWLHSLTKPKNNYETMLLLIYYSLLLFLGFRNQHGRLIVSPRTHIVRLSVHGSEAYHGLTK